MNRDVKKIVYSILEKDNLAREDTMYLIQQTLIEMLPCNAGTAFEQVLQGMKYKGISFEAITRCKRKWLEENPNKISQKAEQIRRDEEEEYYMEYSNHIPHID